MQDIGMQLQCKESFVHIFSFALVFLVPLFANSNDIKVSTLDSAHISLFLDSLLENQSSYSLKYHLVSYNKNRKESYYKAVDQGKSADSLILVSNNQLNDQVRKKILQPFKNLNIGKQFSLTGEDIFLKYYFVNASPKFQYKLYGKKNLAALIFLTTDFNSFLTGSFGMSRINGQVSIVGEIDLKIENLTKNAEQFEIFWKRDGHVSQNIFLKSYYPHFLGSDLGFSIQYYFENYNALFTKSERRIMLNTFLPILSKTKIGYLSGNIFSTNFGKEYGYRSGNYLAVSFNSQSDSRNQRLLPSRGNFLNLIVDGGLERQSMYFKTTFEYQKYFNIIQKTYVKFQTNIYDLTYLNGNVPKSRYFKLGGSSLRGFDDNSIILPKFHVFSFELINQQKRTMQIKTFIDMGSNKLLSIKEYLYGYGFGFKQVNDKTIISVDYSLSSYKWQEGKIHLKWSARL